MLFFILKKEIKIIVFLHHFEKKFLSASIFSMKKCFRNAKKNQVFFKLEKEALKRLTLKNRATPVVCPYTDIYIEFGSN